MLSAQLTQLRRTERRKTMGLFDFFKKSGSTPPPGNGPASKKVAGPAKVVGDKRAQAYDRSEAIRQLADMKSKEAAEALLRRFTFSIDPSITDQEEKEATYEAIVEVGKEALEPVRAFCARAEVLTWPLKILRAVLDDAEYKAELLRLADEYDTDYSRNVEPKLQVVSSLAEVRGDDVREAVERFLEDVNETVRFHAVESTFAQSNKESIPALISLLEKEESVRIKNKVCEGFITKSWKIPDELAATVKSALRDVDFRMDATGAITR
jgi:HEAT repeat protein